MTYSTTGQQVCRENHRLQPAPHTGPDTSRVRTRAGKVTADPPHHVHNLSDSSPLAGTTELYTPRPPDTGTASSHRPSLLWTINQSHCTSICTSLYYTIILTIIYLYLDVFIFISILRSSLIFTFTCSTLFVSGFKFHVCVSKTHYLFFTCNLFRIHVFIVYSRDLNSTAVFNTWIF